MSFSASNVWKYYDATPALRGIECTIAPGERVLVIGANGSGKSTFLKALVGLCELDQGCVQRPSGAQGYFSPELFLYPALQVSDHIRLWEAAVRPATNVYSLYGEFGLERVQYSLVRDLSFGQRVQLALCRAVLGVPELLVLDEPTTGLDEVSVTTLLRNLRAQSAQYQIVASHDLQRFLPWASRVLLLEEGRLVKEGVSHEPQSIFDAVERYRTSNR